MTSDSDNKIILDQPDQEKKKDQLLIMAYTSLGVLAAGIIFQMFHWPFWKIMVLAGMGGMTLRSILLFIPEKHPLFAWMYFFGRISLFVAAGLYFSNLYIEPKLFYIPFVFMLAGLVLIMLRPKDANDNDEEI
jgi:hypothetical protein